MRWQLGGNFEPVVAACKIDWPKCPNALVNYIWFEIVTDVIDCLTNETFLWRILAILLIFTLVVHLIYWQNRWTKAIKINKENLENLDFKIQDLELKVNILTYKAQYGTWPLTFFTRKNSKNNLQNIQLAFSKLDEENFWIKNLWKRKKLYNDRIHCTTQPKLSDNKSHLKDDHTTCTSIKDPSIKDDFLEEKTNSMNEKSQKLVEKNKNEVNDGLAIKKILEEIKSDLLRESNTIGLKLVKSLSENYLSLRARNVSLGRKRYTKNNSKSVVMRVLDKDLCGKKVKLSTRHVNKSKLLSPSKKVTSHLKIQENMSNLFCSDLGDKNNVHETLCQVKQKLESLYIILQNYNNREFQSITSNMYHNRSQMNRGDSTLTEMRSNSKCEYNGSYDSPEVFAIHSICNRISRNSHFPIQIIEHPYNEKHSATGGKTSRMRNTNILKKVGISNTMTLKKQPKSNKEQVNQKLSENHITTIKKYSVSTNTENILKIDKANSTEISMESNSDNKTVTVLLHKTLSYENKQLISEIESEETFNMSKDENMSKQSESFSYLNWQNQNTHFEPKLLDMITEESSGSSMDKRSNTSISRVSEECNDLGSQELQSSATNSHSTVSTIPKNQITAEQRVMINHISDVSHLNSILQNEESPVSNNTKNITMVRDCSYYQEDGSITKAHELVIQSTDDDLKLQANLNSSTFIESDSDSSVNRLIDRLIESERKSKSVRSFSGSRSREDLAVDSLNNLIDSHNFLESTHFENKGSNTEKFNYFEMKPNIIKHNFDIGNENRVKSGISETEENEVQRNSESMITVANMHINHETLTPCVSQSICNRERKEGEMLNKSVSCTGTMNKSSQVPTDHIQSINDFLVENGNGNINMSVNKNCINCLVSNNTLQKNKNYQNKTTNKKELIENGSAIDKHHFDDFCSNNYKLFTQELQVKEEIANQNSYGVINTINNLSSSNDIDLSRELSKSPNSHSKYSQFSSCKGLTKLFSPELRSLEQNIQKKSGSKPFQRSSLKSNYDLNNFKQLKAKSYLNLTSFEKTSPVQTHRRSKSYVTPRDISLNTKNNKIEKTSSSESLVFPNKSPLKGFKSETPKKYSDEKIENEFEAKRENSFESLSHSSVSSSKSSHLVSPRTTSFMCKQEKRRNDSLIDFLNDDYSNINDTKIERSIEASLFSNKSTSKSCIPILKIRMDGTKKNVDDSYARSPLTMTTRSFRIEEKLEPKHENETENTGLHKTIKEDENLCLKNTFELQYSGRKNDCTVNTQCEANEDQDNVTCNESNQPTNLSIIKNEDVNPKNDEIININFLSSCTMQINNIPSQSLFPKKSSKETEVLVKPTTLDTSTSVSDLSEVSNEINKINKLKTFKGPEELTKEEYITVLKMINENSEFKQLSNMDKLCSKLQWDLHR